MDVRLVASRLLDRIMPLPVGLACLALAAVSHHWPVTVALGVVFFAGNVALNKAVKVVDEVPVWFGAARAGLSIVFLPLLILSAGPVSGTWWVAIPSVAVLPLFFKGWRAIAWTAAAIWVCVLAFAMTGPPLMNVASAAGALTLIGLTTLPLYGSLRLHIAGLVEAQVAVERRNQILLERQAELLMARMKAEQAAHTHQTFLANMSHQICTPVAGVIDLLDILSEGESDRQRKTQVAMALQSAEHLLRLVKDVLDLSTLEAGRLSFASDPVDVEAVVRETVGMVRVARPTAVPIRVAFELTGSGWYRGDAPRISQVVLNLVTNALKFTPEGFVDLSVTGDQERLTIRVKDTGIGMSMAQVAIVFDPFRQGSESTARKFGGTGLGLSLSHALMQAMGGDLVCVSRLGEGTTFEGTIVAPQCEKPQSQQVRNGGNTPGERLDGMRVLVAEDNKENQRIIRRLLQELGCLIHVVDDGQQAVEAAADGHFDLVLMDLEMPNMEGVDAAISIRGSGSQVPIAALAAPGMANQRQRCMDAGMNLFLTKPVRREALLGAVQQLMEDHALV
jgi:signal transduction histidine kinase